VSRQEAYLPCFEAEDATNIRDYRVSIWRRMDDAGKEKWVHEVFEYYRNVHGFPYFELTPEKTAKKLWRLRNKPARTKDVEILWDQTATTLCAYYFPHIWKVPFRNKRTAWLAFHNDVYLKDAIRLCFRIKPSVGPSDLIGAFCLGTKASVGVVSRFKPMAAKAIYERYTPDEGGVVYDYACGWGGRFLGAISSKKNLRYIGVDPEPRTHACLLKLAEDTARLYNEPSRAEIHRIGSEIFCPPELEGMVDVAFSSPPYFDLEKYSDDPTQSHVKFNTVDTWLDGYLLQTFSNVKTMLKPGGILALNLIDFDKTKISEAARERILSLGFEHVETLQIQMAQRRGNGQDTTKQFKHEPVYVYRKGRDC